MRALAAIRYRESKSTGKRLYRAIEAKNKNEENDKDS